MEIQSVIIAVVVLGALLFAFFYFDKKISSLGKGEAEKMILLLQQQFAQSLASLEKKMAETRQALDVKLSESNQISRDQLKEMSLASRSSQQIMENIAAQLTRVDESQKQVVDFTAQLKKLQDILRNPKQRGVLGEYFLEETLKNVMAPKNYQMQYAFRDGAIVDAVIKVKEKLIPVDSKFSLERYEQLLDCGNGPEREALEKLFRQDLKNRIDETAKYVRPQEGTVDFAFMFIPSESIYYDLLVNKVNAAQISSRDLIEYAFKEKHVIIVSPTSFLAYLQTVLQGLRALEIEDSAKEIQKNVEKLGRHLQKYFDFHKRLGASLGTTVNHFNNAHAEFVKINRDVVKISEDEKQELIEPASLDRPKDTD